MKSKLMNLGLCFTMVCMAMSALWSCSDSDDSNGSTTPNEPVVDEKPVFDVNDPKPEDINVTSAVFNIIAKNVESYVVKVTEGANAEQPDPILVYKEAESKGAIKKVTENAFKETVAGLEGKKTYSVFFVWKHKEGYDVLSKQVTTPNYTQKLTVLETGMFHVTVHVEVPEDMYYGLGITSEEQYVSLKQFNLQDIDWVMHDEYSGLANPRFKGPQTITLRDGEFQYKGALNEQEVRDLLDPEELPSYSYDIKPGTSYVMFLGQCDENGVTNEFVDGLPTENPGWGPLTASTLPNVTDYTEVCPECEGMTFKGAFAKLTMFSQQANQGTGKVDIRIDHLTEKTGVISFIPTEDVLLYTVMMVDNETLKEELYPLIGGEGGMQAVCLKYGSPLEGEQQLMYPLEKDHTYSIYVTAIYNEEASIQTLNKIDNLKPLVSNKPACELIITPLALNDPYKVGFNIKAPNKDCFAFKYLMNYTHEWYPMLNQIGMESMEANIASAMGIYGAGVNDAPTLEEVNSDKGHDLIFSSIDDTESWIVFETYNVDEKTKLFWNAPENRSKSAKLPTLEPVNSDLMQKLQGTWEATMTNVKGKTVTQTITIGEGPQFVATMPDDVRNKLVDFYVNNNKWTQEKAETTVDKTFAEYKELQKYYTEKYKSQNMLVATGLSYDKMYSKFASSWDLFQSLEYSSYSTEEMFRDYGPKFFLQFEKDAQGKISILVPSTRLAENNMDYLRYVDPFADWSMTLQLFGYNDKQPKSFFMSDFPVKVSEDLNTVTIEPMVENGITYTPSIATQISGSINMWGFQTDTNGIVLKRVNGQQAMRTPGISQLDVPAVANHKGNYYKRTRAPYAFQVKELIHGKVFSPEVLKKNVKR